MSSRPVFERDNMVLDTFLHVTRSVSSAFCWHRQTGAAGNGASDSLRRGV